MLKSKASCKSYDSVGSEYINFVALSPATQVHASASYKLLVDTLISYT